MRIEELNEMNDTELTTYLDKFVKKTITNPISYDMGFVDVTDSETIINITEREIDLLESGIETLTRYEFVENDGYVSAVFYSRNCEIESL